MISPPQTAMEGASLLSMKTKRDDWTESGILSLLEIYESKWLFRNRAKLKASDWDEIAHQVSLHKTPIQCKNKIESMKKRYRSEAASSNPNSASSWRFFARMDALLKGAGTSTPKSDSDRKSIGDVSSSRVRVWKRWWWWWWWGVGEGIELMRDLMVKIEEGRMEMFRDLERVRAEAEIRKWEMEMKRAEIVSKMQLEIAKLVVKRVCGKGNGEEGSGLKTEIDVLARREVMGD